MYQKSDPSYGYMDTTEGSSKDSHVKEGLKQQKIPQKFDKYKFKENGILTHRDRVCVLNVGGIRKMVMKEMHDVPYAKH